MYEEEEMSKESKVKTMCLQTKEHPGVLVVTRSWMRQGTDFSLGRGKHADM